VLDYRTTEQALETGERYLKTRRQTFVRINKKIYDTLAK